MKSALDDTSDFQPQYNADGLIPAICQDAESGDILMMAWMNEEALKLTRETGFATFWARSRKKLWKKGEESGNVLEVREILIDCDQDCLLLKVNAAGPACHTGRRSCFYRVVENRNALEFIK